MAQQTKKTTTGPVTPEDRLKARLFESLLKLNEQQASAYFDAAGRALYFNRGAQLMLGEDATAALKGKPLEKTAAAFGLDLDQVRQAMASLTESRRARLHVSSQDGQRIFRVLLMRIQPPGGELAGFVLGMEDVTEKTRQALELKESEERNRALLEAIPDMIFVLNREGVYLDFLPAAGLETLAPPEEFIGKNYRQMLPSGLSALVGRHMTRAFESGGVQNFEYQLEWRAQATHYDYRLTPMDQDRVLILVRDVSEKKRLEARLRVSEESYRALTNSALDAIITIDAHGRIIAWNAGAARAFGYTEKEALGRSLEFIIPPAMRSRHMQAIAQARLTGEGVVLDRPMEGVGLHKNGEERPFEVLISHWKSQGQDFFTGILRDIRERRETSRQIERLTTAIDQAIDSVVITDTQGAIEYVNPAFERVTGYTQGEAVGQNPRLLKSGRHSPRFYAELWETITQGRTWHAELINKKKNGELYYEDTVITPVSVEGRVTNYIAIKRDVTLNKELMEKMRRLQREYEAFMRHELKNRLSPILGYSDGLLSIMNQNLNEKQITFLSYIKKYAQEMSGLIDDLKKLQDFETGNYDLDMASYDLGLLLSQTIMDFKVLHGPKIDIVLENNAPQPELMIDLALLKGVFTNLIKNAYEHVKDLEDPDQRRIRVSLDERGREFLCVRVNNRGEPIPAARLELFFEKFNTARERKPGGTGLGTTYAYLVTKAHGGHIEVVSNAEEGTTVSLRLPRPSAT